MKQYKKNWLIMEAVILFVVLMMYFEWYDMVIGLVLLFTITSGYNVWFKHLEGIEIKKWKG